MESSPVTTLISRITSYLRTRRHERTRRLSQHAPAPAPVPKPKPKPKPVIRQSVEEEEVEQEVGLDITDEDQPAQPSRGYIRPHWGSGYFPGEEAVILRHRDADFDISYRNVAELERAIDHGILPIDLYHQAVYMYVYGKSKQMPREWPQSLQSVDVRFSRCTPADLPARFPPSLRIVSFFKCPGLHTVDVVAMAESCPDLEEIVLYGSSTKRIHPPITIPPPTDPRPLPHANLRIIDASYCAIEELDMRILPSSLAIFVNEGNLPDRRGLRIETNSRRHPNYIPPRRNVLDNVDDSAVHETFRAQVYSSGHNVHAPSIQQGTNESMNAVFNAYQSACRKLGLPRSTNRDNTLQNKSFREATAELEKMGMVVMSKGVCFTIHEVMSKYTEESTTHSHHAITLAELFHRVWTIIKAHPQRVDIMPVLRLELIDGMDWCFTGRFTRLVNVLSCYVDGVSVGISADEQIKYRMGIVWRELSGHPVLQKLDASQQDKETFFVDRVCKSLIELQILEWSKAVTWADPFIESMWDTELEDRQSEGAKKVIARLKQLYDDLV